MSVLKSISCLKLVRQVRFREENAPPGCNYVACETDICCLFKGGTINLTEAPGHSFQSGKNSGS